MFYYVGPCVALSLNHSTWTSIENYPLPILQKRLWQAAKDFLKKVEQWEAEEAEREKQHYDDLKKYVKGLSKTELQEQLLNALVELEERRNCYW